MTEVGLEKLKKLYREYESDLLMSPMNLEEKSMLAPTYVSKWLLIRRTHVHELEQLEERLKSLREEESVMIRKALKVTISDAQLKKLKLKYNDDIIELETMIKDYRSIISDLSDLVRAVGYYRNDVRNAIEYQRMETG